MAFRVIRSAAASGTFTSGAVMASEATVTAAECECLSTGSDENARLSFSLLSLISAAFMFLPPEVSNVSVN